MAVVVVQHPIGIQPVPISISISMIHKILREQPILFITKRKEALEEIFAIMTNIESIGQGLLSYTVHIIPQRRLSAGR